MPEETASEMMRRTFAELAEPVTVTLTREQWQIVKRGLEGRVGRIVKAKNLDPYISDALDALSEQV